MGIFISIVSQLFLLPLHFNNSVLSYDAPLSYIAWICVSIVLVLIAIVIISGIYLRGKRFQTITLNYPEKIYDLMDWVFWSNKYRVNTDLSYETEIEDSNDKSRISLVRCRVPRLMSESLT